MTYALKTADTKFLMTSKASIQVAVEAAKNAGIPQKHIFLLEGEVPGFTTFKELRNIGEGYGENGQIPAYRIPSNRSNKEICGFLNFSSGTTGLPKAVSSGPLEGREGLSIYLFQLTAIWIIGDALAP